MSLSKTFGTVFIERVFDLFAIVLLGLAAGFWSFRDGHERRTVRIVFAFGLVVVVVLAVGLFVVRNFGRRILTRLPLPAPDGGALRPVRGRRLLHLARPAAAAGLR